MNTNYEKFLLKVVDMYYKEELSQETIAKKLNISRTTVSRALKRAKKEGYVKILIQYPVENTIALEKALEKKFGITEAIVSMTNEERISDFFVAEQAAEYFIRILKSNMVVGIAWGRTLKKMIDHLGLQLKNIKVTVKEVEIVSVQGSSRMKTHVNEEYRLTYSNVLAGKAAELVHGVCHSLSAPMLVRNEEVKKILEQEKDVFEVLEKAKQSDVVFFGIGSLSENSALFTCGSTSVKDLEQAKQKGGVGEVSGRIYDKNGCLMDLEINKRQMSIPFEDIFKIPLRVGVAYGKEKVQAIKGAMKGNIINVLITDDKTAQCLLEDCVDKPFV